MSTSIYPVRVDASLEPHLNRFLWLVKWLLVIPHYVVLAFLWLAFVVLSMVAFFAILFTGKYPRSIFDFNVGVLRWSWRVAYYAYGALGTDRYPPFSLDDVPDYPAHLEVEYPEHLSRGLVLVKWWLLAIPHYLIVGVFVGGGLYVANEAAASDHVPLLWGGGLIGLLVLIAAVVLLFTGTYPRSIFDLVLGMNRWVLRVAAYAGLMTDDYPPFRLDMGPDDPGSGRLMMSPAAAPGPAPTTSAGTAYPPIVRGTGTGAPRGWSAGRIIALTTGSLIFVAAAGLVTAGVGATVAEQTLRDDSGFVMTGEETFGTTTYAIASQSMQVRVDSGAFVPDSWLGDAKLRVTPDEGAVFVGVGATSDVAAYLADVGHVTVVDFAAGDEGETGPVYRGSATGGAPAVLPADAGIWVDQSAGTGTQSVVWPVEDGDWTVVVMNADGTAGVGADVAAGARLPALGWLVAVLLSVGGCLLVLAAALIIGALRTGSTGGDRA